MPKQKKHKKTHSQLIRKRLALTLLIIGLIFTLIPSIFYLNQTIQLAYFTPEVNTQNQSSFSKPVKIAIPSVLLDLPIEETAIVNSRWNIAQNGASYLGISARPGEKGPIILYAHNTNDRFGPILWIQNRSSITIETEGGKKYQYTVSKTTEVSPNQMDIFNQKDEVLILYTCTGFADLKRFVVIAIPQQKRNSK